MVLRDPYAGHRNSFTGEPDGPLDEWTSWDFALAMATQFIIDGTTVEGHLAWEIEADDVDVVAVHEVNKARQAIDMITNAEGYKPEPGEYYRTELFRPFDRDIPKDEWRWQTRSEWIEKMIEKEEANQG